MSLLILSCQGESPSTLVSAAIYVDYGLSGFPDHFYPEFRERYGEGTSVPWSEALANLTETEQRDWLISWCQNNIAPHVSNHRLVLRLNGREHLIKEGPSGDANTIVVAIE